MKKLIFVKTALSGSLGYFQKVALFILFTLLVALSSTQGMAQTTSPQVQTQARAEIQRRGLEEAEVRARLQQRGIDIDNVTPEQLPALQTAIEAVLKEMEDEKASAKPGGTSPPVAPPPAAQPGADKAAPSPQESVAEKAAQQNQQNLQPPQIFGQHLFRGKDLAVFRTTNEVKPPDTYVLSTGDVLTISIFGASQFDSQFEIGKDGTIKPSNLPKIFLKGLRLGQARELLRSRFAQFYRFAPEQFAVSLTAARTITVNIFGEVNNIGSFNVSAINTAFNALVAAGGPTDLGTVRSIQVIRGRKTQNLDLYEFINNPSIQYDFFLEDNDILHIPMAGRVVGVQGAVRRPFRYELIPGENLIKLLDLAGGLTANAYRDVVQVQRFLDDKQVLIDVNWKDLLAQKQDFTLLNGDELVVRNIPSPIENTAIIEGMVELPGAYSLGDTRRVSDLLKKGGLRPESRTDVAFLLRSNPDGTGRLLQLNLNNILAAAGSTADLTLQPKDRLTVYATARYTDRTTVSIGGAVRNPVAAYPFSPDSALTLQRAILLAGGLRPEASGRGLILRTNTANPKEKTYLEVDLAAAFDRPTAAENVILQPFDQLEVLSRSAFSDEATIRISGAVRKPGEFAYGRKMSLRDALLLAGGLKLEAARNRIDISRIQIRENEPTRTIVATLTIDSTFAATGTYPGDYTILPFDEIAVRTVPEFELQRYVDLSGEVRYPGRYALVNDNETLAELLERAGGLSQEAFAEGATLFRTEGGKGYVITNLPEALHNPSSPHNHILKENDRITVPKKEDLVSIRTAYTNAAEVVRAPLLASGLINVAHSPGKRAGWYVRAYAAGFAKKAKRSRVTVEQPNGKISRTVNWGLFKIYPKVTKGSVVTVGGKPVKDKKTKTGEPKKGVDWDKALPQILAAATTFATLLVAVAAFKK